MFRAVNTESEHERKKIMHEKTKIQSSYLSALKTLNIDKFVDLKIQFEQNSDFYAAARANLLFSLVKKAPRSKLEEIYRNYSIQECKVALFEYARRSIEEGEFIKARKLLNLARKKGWWCNDLFDLEEVIEGKYFGRVGMKRKPIFEDFIN